MKVGIAGKMTAGKSTVRKYLEDNYGFSGIAFADPIKHLEKIHSKVHPSTWEAEVSSFAKQLVPDKKMDYLVDSIQKEIMSAFNNNEIMPGKKNRKLLQDIGNGLRRIYPSIWIDYTVNQCPESENIVIDDVRYVNEANALKDKGFKIWRVDVSRDVQHKRICSLYGEESLKYVNDIGETELDYHFELVDYYLDGSSPLEEMLSSVDFILELSGFTKTEEVSDE